MQLSIQFDGEFSRSQIRDIAKAHPALGEKLAAAAYLAGAPSSNVAGKSTRQSGRGPDIADDTLWRLNQRHKTPQEGTKYRALVDELITQFGKEPFMYINVKEAAKKVGAHDSYPATLRTQRVILPLES